MFDQERHDAIRDAGASPMRLFAPGDVVRLAATLPYRMRELLDETAAGNGGRFRIVERRISETGDVSYLVDGLDHEIPSRCVRDVRETRCVFGTLVVERERAILVEMDECVDADRPFPVAVHPMMSFAERSEDYAPDADHLPSFAARGVTGSFVLALEGHRAASLVGIEWFADASAAERVVAGIAVRTSREGGIALPDGVVRARAIAEAMRVGDGMLIAWELVGRDGTLVRPSSPVAAWPSADMGEPLAVRNDDGWLALIEVDTDLGRAFLRGREFRADGTIDREAFVRADKLAADRTLAAAAAGSALRRAAAAQPEPEPIGPSPFR